MKMESLRPTNFSNVGFGCFGQKKTTIAQKIFHALLTWAIDEAEAVWGQNKKLLN